MSDRGRMRPRTGCARRGELAVARSRRIAAAVGIVLVVLVLAAAGPTAAAHRSPGRQAATTVELVGQTTWVRPGEPYDVDVRVTGAPAGATIDMQVHDLLESRNAFRATLDDGGELGDLQHTVDARPLTGAPGPDGTLSIGFTPGEAGAGLPSRGVYPVEVRVRSADGDVLASLVTYLTYLTETPPEFAPLEVAVLVDIAADPSLLPDGDRALPEGTLERARERLAVVQDTPGVPLTLAPRPETVEGLVHGGVPAAATVDQLREAAAGRPVLARPFVDIDLAALQGAGLISEANQQADGGANVVRSRLGVEPIGGIWLSGPTLGSEAAGIAVDLGIDRAVVPPSAIEDDGNGAGGDDQVDVPVAPVRLGDGGPVTMVSDPALAAHLTSDDPTVATVRFVAELASMWVEAPSVPRAVVVHLPPDADIDPGVVSTALRALTDDRAVGAVQAVPIDQIFKDVPPLEDGPTTVTAAPHDVTDDLRPIAPAVQSARMRVAGVGALLDDPSLSTSLGQSLLMSTGSDTPDDERLAYVEHADETLGSVSGAVVLPDEFEITLTSRSSSIPVTVTNNLDRPLSVRIELDSDQLEFPDGDVLTPVLTPGTNRLEVAVRTRTSGAFTLDVTVESPDQSIVLDTSTFDVRSTAISGVGIVLSIGACLFLAIWWARHWRSARRSAHLMPSAGGDDDTAHTAVASDATAASAAATEGGTPYQPAHMARQRTRSG